VVGINYGENPGADVTCSGTVGAALQAATCGVPALAVSRQAPKEVHLNLSDDVDFTAAAHFTRFFARRMLGGGRSPLTWDVPQSGTFPDTATPQTPLAADPAISPGPTSVPGPAPRRSDLSRPGRMDYEGPRGTSRGPGKPDSDIYALVVGPGWWR
jgi:hypothetical protein